MQTKKTLVDWFELRRKLFHIALGIVLITLIYLSILSWISAGIILMIGVIISLVAKNITIPIITPLLDWFERPHHREFIPGRGVITIFLAVTLLLLFFEKNIILASLAIWTLGDSISALVGMHYGRIRHPFNSHRLLEGTIAGIICGTLGAMLFVPWYDALGAAIIAMLFESADITFFGHDIDDNFLVPIVSAIVITIIGLIGV